MRTARGDINHAFISYAHIDDQIVPGAEFGWISYLHRGLKPLLERALGAQCRVFFDQSTLRGNHSLTPELEREIEASETFVAVLTPGYLASKWCRREMELFLTRCGDARSERIFLVDPLGIKPQDLEPLGLSDLVAYKFWYTDSKARLRTLGDPKPDSEERDYFRRVLDLANDIARTVREGRAAVENPAQVAINVEPYMHAGAGPAAIGSGLARIPATTIRNGTTTADARQVLLAEVTDDLESSRQQLRRYLEQAGVPVHCCSSYGLKVEDFDRQLKTELGNAALFVQLLSAVPFRTLPGVFDGYGLMQLKRAVEGGVRTLQWRDSRLNVDMIEDANHRTLVNLETVQAVSFESFKKAVVEALIVKTDNRNPKSSFVFINAEKRDFNLAKRIQNHVETVAASALPLNAGSAEEIRTDIEENMIDCDGLLIVYGDGSAAWVHQQLRLYNKFLPRRQKPIKLVAIIEAPPEDKPDIGVRIPGMQVLNFRGGIDDEKLRGLFRSMSGGREQ